MYMDDVLSGGRSLEDVVCLRAKLIDILSSGGFQLRKWRANNDLILQELREKDNAKGLLVLDEQEVIKTLGLLWCSETDTLQYEIHMQRSERTTKRSILSMIARIYDPLGMIGPVVIIAKMIMQELWKTQTNWDGEVAENVGVMWKNFCQSLHLLQELKVPRNANPKNQDYLVTLHGFSDASERAYGACIYVVSTDQNGEKQCRLLCSKSKVAPMKTMTLPRLELTAARLLAKLVAVVREAVGSRIEKMHLWSDSTITLHWIRTPPCNLKTFEANRVVEIQELTQDCTWRHVPTRYNPADHLSRGLYADKLIVQEDWWKGPEWITSEDSWPSGIIPELEHPLPMKTQVVAISTLRTNYSILRKYSSFEKLQRVIAYCMRFVRMIKKEEIKGPLTSEELRRAHDKILGWTQEEMFSEDIVRLRIRQEVSRKSQLLTLNPFLDGAGLIRVGGRLENSELAMEQRHPILLPRNHHITDILLRGEHHRLLHCGPKQLLYSIRQRYWTLSGGRADRKVTQKCIKCFRMKPKIPEIQMGNLPSERVRVPMRPFETTGVDYAGPIQIREGKRRGRIPISKGYIAIFTCFATKAVHLELVSELTTEAFLAALRRFTARRGICTNLHSDNATNFVGAARELRETYKLLAESEDAIKTTLAKQNINWNFIPPRSPHFGGLWEAAVKSVKRHLHTVTKGLIFTFEEYCTLLSEIESILNSRPLMPMSADPSDLNVLCPSHFLIGDSLLEPATKCFTDISDSRLSRWQAISKRKQHFWRRWQREYLQHLQSRTKWTAGQDNVKVGMMVMLIDDNQPPLHWHLGRVVEVFPGQDGLVRVVRVKTASGLFKRAVKKVCILPFEQ